VCHDSFICARLKHSKPQRGRGATKVLTGLFLENSPILRAHFRKRELSFSQECTIPQCAVLDLVIYLWHDSVVHVTWLIPFPRTEKIGLKRAHGGAGALAPVAATRHPKFRFPSRGYLGGVYYGEFITPPQNPPDGNWNFGWRAAAAGLKPLCCFPPITTAKVSNKFLRESPYISNKFSRESPDFQTRFRGSKWSPPHSKDLSAKLRDPNSDLHREGHRDTCVVRSYRSVTWLSHSCGMTHCIPLWYV